MKSNFITTSFLFLSETEKRLMDELCQDPNLAFGRFETSRIINFNTKTSIANFYFTDDSKKNKKDLGSITCVCLSDLNNQYMFKTIIDVPKLNKTKTFSLNISTFKKKQIEILKLVFFFKELIVKILTTEEEENTEELVKDSEELNQKTLEAIIEKECKNDNTQEKIKQERTIQMNPQDLAKDLIEENRIEEKNENSLDDTFEDKTVNSDENSQMPNPTEDEEFVKQLQSQLAK